MPSLSWFVSGLWLVDHLQGALAVGTRNRRTLLPKELVPSITDGHIYVVFWYIRVSNKYFKIASRNFPKKNRGLPFPGCKNKATQNNTLKVGFVIPHLSH